MMMSPTFSPTPGSSAFQRLNSEEGRTCLCVLLFWEGPGKFVIREVPIPQPQDGEVLIKGCQLRSVPLKWVCGTVLLVNTPVVSATRSPVPSSSSGSGVDSLSEGQRVTIFTDRHGYSEYVAVPAEYVIPIGK